MSILELLYLMIPAYVANMTPVLVRSVGWNLPMDFGLSLGGKRILGENKTWKGFFSGVAMGIFSGALLYSAYWPFDFSPFFWSAAVSAGALAGDALKSFFKRRVGIKSGKPWIPFDQLDYSVGALALGSLIFFPGWFYAAVIAAISTLGHIAVNHFAFYTGIRGEKW